MNNILKQIQLNKQKLDDRLSRELSSAHKCIRAEINPVNKWIYVSTESDLQKHRFEDGMNSIHIGAFNKAIADYDAGRLSDSEFYDKINFGVFNIKDGWQDKAAEWESKARKAVADGEITQTDYSGIEVSSLTAIIYGYEYNANVLQNALRTVPVDGIVYEYPELTSRPTISRNITYGDQIAVKSAGLKTNKKTLKCDATHFAAFNDVQYRPTAIDVWRTNLDLHAQAFIIDRAQQVAEVLKDTTIPAISGTNWETGTNNPYLDITKALAVIFKNGGVASKIALHPMALAPFAGNANTKTSMATSMPIQYNNGEIPEGYLYAGVGGYADRLMDVQNATVWDPFYIPLLQGPRGSARYQDIPRFANGFVAFEWKLIFIADTGKARRITSINSLTEP